MDTPIDQVHSRVNGFSTQRACPLRSSRQRVFYAKGLSPALSAHLSPALSAHLSPALSAQSPALSLSHEKMKQNEH